MRRLCVFVFYDYKGIVDDYVVYLLDSIKKVAEKSIVLVNGFTTDEGKSKLKIHSDVLLMRDNKGFDWGAYRDYFLIHSAKDKILQYDEIILMNNSFFGPFYLWNEMFDTMKDCGADIWGITDAKKCEILDEETMRPHIQGYFLVLNRRVIEDESFMDFWKKMEYPASFKRAVYDGEIFFSQWFMKKGFRLDSYIDVVSDGVYKDNTKNYISAADEFIIKHRCPILKWKAISPLYYESFSRVMEYLDNNSLYDLNLIYENINRKDKDGMIKPYSFIQIDSFCESHNSIYLYGAGEYAAKLRIYLMAKGYAINGNIVTDNKCNEENIAFNDYSHHNNDGIIIAVGRKYCEEIYMLLRTKINELDILKPEYVW